ncbi:MAG: hypothetical protein V4448_01290 [Pseudomonadota bacterium]
MHKREIEAVDARIGVKFQDAGRTAKGYGGPHFKIDNLVVKGHRHISLEDCQMLRKVIHAYMAFANEIPCEHFNWNDETNSAEFSDLGMRLIACFDLYQKQILKLGNEASVELSWNSDIYAESANVRIFRKVLVRAADDIRKKHRAEYACLSNTQLRREEVEALQRSMQGALALMNRPRARRLNKRLYDEMFKTKRSIQECLPKIKNIHPRFGVLPLILSFSSEERFRLLSMLPDLNILRVLPFPANYLNHFEHVSAFVSTLKTELNREVVGHLIKLTGVNPSDPRCILLLCITQQACQNIALLQARIKFIWADHVLGTKDKNLRDVSFVSGIKINSLIEVSKSSKESNTFANLVESVFIQELKYQRLRLPARRRSWGKSNF